MYDLARSLVIFDSPTYHPILEFHTGYIFHEYQLHFIKPRELFFQFPYEAQLYALKTGADWVMDPRLKPELVTALDYLANDEDSALYGATGAQWTHNPDVHLNFRKTRKPPVVTERETDVASWEAEEDKGTGLGAPFAVAGDVSDIDYFGE